ncbi:uncharacterized protein ACIBXB_004172 [Morphnus guianensis]
MPSVAQSWAELGEMHQSNRECCKRHKKMFAKWDFPQFLQSRFICCNSLSQRARKLVWWRQTLFCPSLNGSGSRRKCQAGRKSQCPSQPQPQQAVTFLLSGLRGAASSPEGVITPLGSPKLIIPQHGAGWGGSGAGGKGPAVPSPSPRSLPEPASPATRPHRHQCSWCPAGQSCPSGPCQGERRLSRQLPNPSCQLRRRPLSGMKISSRG